MKTELENKIDIFDYEYAFLSNFYPSIIKMDDDIIYPSVEHAFQAYKTIDLEIRKQIASLKSPGLAKRVGRKLDLRKDWEKIKCDVMVSCIRKKFEITEFKEKLLATNDAILIEGNTWHDNFWGNCKCEKCIHILGKNQLGKTLMKIREEIKEKE